MTRAIVENTTHQYSRDDSDPHSHRTIPHSHGIPALQISVSVFAKKINTSTQHISILALSVHLQYNSSRSMIHIAICCYLKKITSIVCLALSWFLTVTYQGIQAHFEKNTQRPITRINAYFQLEIRRKRWCLIGLIIGQMLVKLWAGSWVSWLHILFPFLTE